jgi:hypothetical protein
MSTQESNATLKAIESQKTNEHNTMHPPPPSPSPTDPQALFLHQIQHQIEYYLSPTNLSRDVFLQQVLDAHQGMVPFHIIARFPKLQQIYHLSQAQESIQTIIQRAVANSTHVSMTGDGCFLFCSHWTMNQHHQQKLLINSDVKDSFTARTPSTVSPTSFTTAESNDFDQRQLQFAEGRNLPVHPYFAPVYVPSHPNQQQVMNTSSRYEHGASSPTPYGPPVHFHRPLVYTPAPAVWHHSDLYNTVPQQIMHHHHQQQQQTPPIPYGIVAADAPYYFPFPQPFISPPYNHPHQYHQTLQETNMDGTNTGENKSDNHPEQDGGVLNGEYHQHQQHPVEQVVCVPHHDNASTITTVPPEHIFVTPPLPPLVSKPERMENFYPRQREGYGGKKGRRMAFRQQQRQPQNHPIDGNPNPTLNPSENAGGTQGGSKNQNYRRRFKKGYKKKQPENEQGKEHVSHKILKEEQFPALGSMPSSPSSCNRERKTHEKENQRSDDYKNVLKSDKKKYADALLLDAKATKTTDHGIGVPSKDSQAIEHLDRELAKMEL